jgi:hypothetical protein
MGDGAVEPAMPARSECTMAASIAAWVSYRGPTADRSTAAALKHFPSGSFNADAARLACAVIAYNLSRAAGVLAGGKLGKARTATTRTKLINIPARLAYSAGTDTLHRPANSRREQRFHTMFDAVQAPPKAA